MRLHNRRALLVALAWLIPAAPAARAGYYTQANLVSDLTTVGASTVDPDLKNPWGVANGPGGPFWVSNAGSDTSTLYDGQGHKIPLTVSVPGGPTGQVFNDTASFLVSSTDAKPAAFLFDTLGGGIYAWDGKSGTSAVAEVTGTGAVYTGLALGSSHAGSVLYAADVLNNKVDVYGGSFQSLSGTNGAFAGKFLDPNLPSGFSVFNVVNLGGTLYVTYSSLAGGGVIDKFDLDGNFLGRFAGNPAGGPLAGPWSLALAPKSFGQFGGDLLVSNNDDGTIAAYNPTTGAFLGDLLGTNGKAIVNTGIWSIEFGGGVGGADPNSLYIFAGINGEQDGLIARISSVPEPSSLVLLGLGGAFSVAVAVARRRRAFKPRAWKVD